jgi:hypothetical protein
MRQCELSRGNRRLVAWIPTQFAIKGRYVRLLDVNGWRIDAVGVYQKSVDIPRGYFAGGVFHS